MVRDKPQVNMFGTDARQRVHKKLKSWYPLTLAVERLTRQIQSDKEDLDHLYDRIESSVVQKYEQMDMPRGGGVTDRTANLVASIADKRDEIEASILDKQADLTIYRRQLREIEGAIQQLNPRDADIVRQYYLHRLRWESIAVSAHISKSLLYRVLDKALDSLADRL